MQVLGEKATTDTHQGMGARRATADDRGGLRLDSKDLQGGPRRFERLARAGDMAASTDASDQIVQPLREIVENLLGRNAFVDRDVGWVCLSGVIALVLMSSV